MKIFYWSPFFSNVATIKAVVRSAETLVKFPKEEKYKVSLVDAIGEWDTASISTAEKIWIQRKETIRYPSSLGILYTLT